MKRTASLILALLLTLSLCACGSKDKETAAEAPAAAQESAKTEKTETASAPVDSPAGHYKLTGMVSEGSEVDVSELEELGMIFYLVLNEDGTGFMDMLGEQQTLKWDDTSIFNDDETSMGYTYANGVLEMAESEAEKLTFTRLTDEELAFYKEHGSYSLDSLFAGGEMFEQSGEIGRYYVELVGAEAVKNEDGDPAIRIWYDFTNDSDQVIAPMWALSGMAEQDGEMLDTTYLFGENDVPESANGLVGVAPGYTIRCTGLYKYDPAGGIIKASVGEFGGDAVYMEYDPQALPGAPEAKDFAKEDPSMPAYMANVPETGKGAEILGVARGTDWEGRDAVIVRFRFTNTSAEDESFTGMFDSYVMQDGYSLEATFDGGDTEDEGNLAEEIAAGESMEGHVTYLLRSGDPIAVVLKAYVGDDYFGKAFELPAN